MPDDETGRWPLFTLVTYAQPTSIPQEWDEELLAKGVPDGLVVEARRELVLLQDPEVGPLVCFGVASPYHYVCLDPHSKRVVDIVLLKPVETDPASAKFVRSAWLVNTTLDQFIASVRMVTARFPFDSEGAGDDRETEEVEDEWVWENRLDDERNHAAEELEEALRRIDPAAVVDRDSFWMTFIDDMLMGDYSARDILTPRDR